MNSVPVPGFRDCELELDFHITFQRFFIHNPQQPNRERPKGEILSSVKVAVAAVKFSKPYLLQLLEKLGPSREKFSLATGSLARS